MTDNIGSVDEEGRIRALERFDLLDTPEEAQFENIVSLIRKILNVPVCAISLMDRNRVWFKARRGFDFCEVPRDSSFCTHTIKGEQPFIVENALEDRRFSDNPFVTGEPQIRSYAGIALGVPGGYNLGCLCVMDTKPRNFLSSDIAILKQFARSVVSEFELRQIATIDHTTKALSWRGWQECAIVRFKQAVQDKTPLTLAVLDIDHFKWINNRFGYAAGDQVLKALADLCMRAIRETDIFGRIGGEEFGLLLPDTDVKGAKAIVERLRTAFQNIVHQLGERVTASISIGIAELAPDHQGIDALLEQANNALDNAKKNGRNCTFVTVDERPDEHSNILA